MGKALILDNDGVIINSDLLWNKDNFVEKIFNSILGKDIFQKAIKEMKHGFSPNLFYRKCQKYGYKESLDTFYSEYDKKALENIYSKAPITRGIDNLIDIAYKKRFKIGVVSSGRKKWIIETISRLDNKDKIDYIESVNDRRDLKAKPDPDGYIEAIKMLNSNKKDTIIIEDSNTGITAAKKSGAKNVICLQEHLSETQIKASKGADIYVSGIETLIKLINIL